MRLCAFIFPPDLFILQGYALRTLQMTFGDFAWCWKFEQTILIFFKSH